MPNKKDEFKPLTYKRILKNNPERKELAGNKGKFKDLISKGTKQEPFDKK